MTVWDILILTVTLALVVEGLWGMAFGNGAHNQGINTLYFTAGPDDENGGEEEAPPARRGDLLLPQACAGELRYRIAPPPGFRPRPP